jgi:hypothetical protein
MNLSFATRTSLYPLIAVVALLLTSCAVIAPPPVSVSISPDTLTLDPGEESTLAASVSGGSPFTDRGVRWRVEPESLGTVSASGHFAAGSRSGTGTVTATSAGAAGTVQVTVRCPATRTVGGISFAVTCSASADTYVESGLATPARTAALAHVEPDIAAVTGEVGRAFQGRALIYVFSDRESFVPGVRALFGDRAARTATEAEGFFTASEDAIAIDWRESNKTKPMTTLRHELTHRLIWETVGDARFDDLPTWLNEGLAHVAEATVPGTAWIAARDRTAVGSMAARDLLPSLADMQDLTTWNGRSGLDASYQYLVAAQAVRFLRADLGPLKLSALLESIRTGTGLPAGYTALTGRSFDEFVASFPARARAAAEPLPGLAVAPDSPEGPGISLIAYGFAPGSSLTVQVSGAATGRSSKGVDKFGNELIVLGGDFPAGRYTATATNTVGERATLTFTK